MGRRQGRMVRQQNTGAQKLLGGWEWGARPGLALLGARNGKDVQLQSVLPQAHCGLHLPYLVGIVQITPKNPFSHF